jgi:hypothetical protein
MLSAGLGLMLPLGKAVEASARYDALVDTGNVSAHAFRVGMKYRY